MRDHLIKSKHIVTLALALGVLPLNGCASLIKQANPWTLSTESCDDGTVLRIKNPQSTWHGLGYAADAYVMANIANLLLIYPETKAAWASMALFALTSIVSDFAIHKNLPAIKPPNYLEIEVEEGKSVRLAELKKLSDADYEIFLPLQKDNSANLSRITVMDDSGKVLNSSRVQLASVQSLREQTTTWPMTFQRGAVPKTMPPKLTTNITIEEPIGDRAVHAGEGGTLIVKVTNSGKGPAEGVFASLKVANPIKGLNIPSRVQVGKIESGQTREIRIPIEAEQTLQDAKANVSVFVEDKNQFDAPPARIIFQTRRHQPVVIAIEQIGIDNASGIPRRGEQVDIQALVRNKGLIPGRGVSATLLRQHSGLVQGGPETIPLGTIPVGGYSIATFSIFVKNSYDGPQTLPLAVRLEEAQTGLKQEENIAVSLDRSGPKISEVNIAVLNHTSSNVPVPELAVDVDQPLQHTVPINPDAVAIVIGIERYNKKLPGVNFAWRDAITMERYFMDALGVPKENIFSLVNDDATKANIQVVIEEKLKTVVNPKKSKVYVYYAGHGAPDANTRTPYLVPYDGDPNYPSVTCYPLSNLYSSLGQVDAKSVTVILDACFTGQDGRGEKPTELLANARPLFVESVAPSVPKGLTVLAAAGSRQISSGYPEKRHGLFTYYFLKALRGDGIRSNAKVSTVFEYLKDQVARQARRMGRVQEPVLVTNDQDESFVEQ